MMNRLIVVLACLKEAADLCRVAADSNNTVLLIMFGVFAFCWLWIAFDFGTGRRTVQ